VTVRGAKHLVELGDMVAAGHRAVMMFLVQRPDCSRFTLAADIDPAYAEAYALARSRGVETLCYGCAVTPEEVRVTSPVPLEI
jgi:sugar fermentation stimulation protein A